MSTASAESAAVGGFTASASQERYRSSFAWLAAAFALGAVAVALARSQQPFDHGWWLVAYLGLVGGLSQLALGAGQLVVTACCGRPPAGRRVLRAELVLWNLGVVLVPAGVLGAADGVVLVGSIALLVALTLFGAGTRARSVQTAGRSYLYAYRVVVVFLTGSVIVGTALAGALPWQ